MIKKLAATGMVATFVLASVGGGLAAAQSSDAEVAISETQAIELALVEVPGEVQETELENEDGKHVYEIEILSADGKEMEVEIDAQTGEILEVEAEDDDDNDKDDVDTDKS